MINEKVKGKGKDINSDINSDREKTTMIKANLKELSNGKLILNLELTERQKENFCLCDTNKGKKIFYKIIIGGLR